MTDDPYESCIRCGKTLRGPLELHDCIPTPDPITPGPQCCPVHGIPDCSPLLNGCSRLTDPITPGDEAAYREQAEALIADLRARVAHYEALAVAARDEALTKAALAVDFLFINVRGFDESWDRGYRQGVQDAAYAVRELRGGTTP